MDITAEKLKLASEKYFSETSDEKIKEDLEETITFLHDTFEKELFESTEAELEERWFFKFDPKKSLPLNIYIFCDMLNLYSRFCRRWEEHHNGSICVVERVRDKYLMPKINDFSKQIMKYYLLS